MKGVSNVRLYSVVYWWCTTFSFSHRLRRHRRLLLYVLLLSRNKFQMWPFPLPSLLWQLCFIPNLNNQSIQNKNTKTWVQGSGDRLGTRERLLLVAYSTAAKQPLTFPDGAAATNAWQMQHSPKILTWHFISANFPSYHSSSHSFFFLLICPSQQWIQFCQFHLNDWTVIS